MVDRSASKMFVKMAFVYGGSLATIQKKKKRLKYHFHPKTFTKVCY